MVDAKDALEYVVKKIEIEMNSVTDNPIIFPGENQKLYLEVTSTENLWHLPLTFWE